MITFQQVCPHCKVSLDGASAVGQVSKQTPTAGDYSMCITCGEISVMGNDGLLRMPSVDEYIVAGKDEDISRMRVAWNALQKAKAEEATEPANDASILDYEFMKVHAMLMSINAPNEAVTLCKSIFAYGVMSVMEMIGTSGNAVDAARRAMKLKKYRMDIQKYIREK